MRYFVLLIAMILLSAGSALAGPVDSPLPGNTCPTPLGAFKLALVANEVGTDFGGPVCGAGGSCAETMIVCHHTGKTLSPSIDVAVELFNSAGALIVGPGPLTTFCGLAAGASATFTTPGGPLVPPYIFAIGIGIGPQAPLGSLRIVSTKPTIACDVTLIDLAAVLAGFSPGPTVTEDVTVTVKTNPQKGD